MNMRFGRCLLAAALIAGIAAAAAAEDARPEEDAAGLQALRMTSLRVSANGRSFFYTRTGSGLSVNGGQADEEVFSTLLGQIRAAVSGESGRFAPRGELLLTVTVGGETDRTISFYRDGADESRVIVLVSGGGSERTCGTEAWRVGTILLACEGTQLPRETEEP